MAKDTTNILVGVYDSYIAPVAEALPELDDNDDGSLTFAGNWSDMGHTEGGAELTYTKEYYENMVDAYNAPIDDVITKEMAILKIFMAETNLQNYQRAFGAATLTTQAAAADVSGQDILKVGDASESFKCIALHGESPEGYFRVFKFHKIKPNSIDTVNFKKSPKTLLAVSFKVYCDPTQSAGERLFVGYDMTAVPTS